MEDRLGAIERAEPSEMNGAARTEIYTKDLVEILWRGRWIVLVSVLVSAIAGWVYLKQSTPLYSSSARLYVEQTGPKIIGDSVDVMSQANNYLATQCEVIKSSAITSIAIESSDLARLKTFSGSQNPIGSIRAGLDVSVAKDNDIITVSYLSPRPEESARVVNAVVDAYITYHAKQKQSTAAEVLKILQKEKEKREGELSAKMKQLLEFRQANSNIAFDTEKSGDKPGFAAQKLTALTEALLTAQLAESDAKVNYDMAKEAAADPAKLAQFAAAQQSDPRSSAVNSEDGQLRGELREAQLQLQALSLHYLPDHPILQVARGRVERLEAQTGGAQPTGGSSDLDIQKRFAANYLAAAEQRWLSAKHKAQELQTTFGKSLQEEQQFALSANNKMAVFAMLDSDFRRTEKLCDTLDDRIKELHVTEDAGAMNITVLESARPASSPSKPDRARILTIAAILGIALGFSLAFVNAWMDQRFRSAMEIQSKLSLRVLGALPDIAGDRARSSRGRRVLLEPMSEVAEAFRMVHAAVNFRMSGASAKTLLVTSPASGDGKSVFTSNFAIVLAQSGERTLILDADFRRPTQHRIFRHAADVGISSVMAGTATLEEAVHATGIKGLDLLPCGPIPQNPAEMINSQPFADMLLYLAGKYDRVILDAPPVMAVADARNLATMCDAAVLVLRAEKSTLKLSSLAREALASMGVNILGVVVNGVPSRPGAYGYYHGLRYGYYKNGYAYAEGAAPATNGKETSLLAASVDSETP
ncbi:MAG: Tyrosine-protein kinase ptk [Phycisphaerales bacterium]|nr:Tyrosine-protein kinase ptk [Phycisphaerales bacterium]